MLCLQPLVQVYHLSKSVDTQTGSECSGGVFHGGVDGANGLLPMTWAAAERTPVLAEGPLACFYYVEQVDAGGLSHQPVAAVLAGKRLGQTSVDEERNNLVRVAKGNRHLLRDLA